MGDAPRRGPLGALLSLGTVAYSTGVGLRRAAYRAGWVSVSRAGCPVISVGNIAVGGTGKTPFCIMLVERLSQLGLQVAVLSRGYGAKVRSRKPVIVSRGDGPLVDVEVSSDEPALIARRTSASVVVCPDRAAGARVAVEELGAQVLVLDDGFQHWRLHRDLDVVLLDARRPFGDGRLLPAGRLREPPEAIGRAGLIVLAHGSNTAPPRRDFPGAVEVTTAATPVLVDGQPRTVDHLDGQRLVVLAGIGRPERFVETVEALGAEVVGRHLHRDHAWITRRQVEAALDDARDQGAAGVITTEKDAVRMGDAAADLQVLQIETRVRAGEDRLQAALDRTLAGVLGEVR